VKTLGEVNSGHLQSSFGCCLKLISQNADPINRTEPNRNIITLDNRLSETRLHRKAIIQKTIK